MKRKCLVIILFLSVVLLFASSSWAQEECCCTMTCNFTDLFDKPQELDVNNCWDSDAVFACDEELICIAEMIGNIEFWKYKDFDGAGCYIETGDDCSVGFLLGADDPRLNTLRQFRDEVLSKTPEGQEIIKLYYEWSPVIVKAMEEDDGFKQEVKQMIDGVLELMRGVK